MNRKLPGRLIRANFFVFGLISGAVLFAQQYPFLAVPGGPANIGVLFQDHEGKLWVGGDRLAYYDGSRFYFLSDYGLPNAPTYSLDEDSRGGIWIGTAAGIYRFADGRVQKLSNDVAISIAAATPEIAIAAVEPPGKGLQQKASFIRLQFTGETWKTQGIPGLESLGPFTRDHNGRLVYPWMDSWSDVGLEDAVRWRPGDPTPPTHHPQSFNPMHEVSGPTRVLRDRYGCLWTGFDSSNFYDCGDGVQHAAPFDGASVGAAIQENADGSMLLAGYTVVALGRPGGFRVARTVNGLPQVVKCAIQALDGTVWLGTTQGLYRFPTPFQMEFWGAREGVDSPWCVQGSGGRVFACLDHDVGELAKDRQRWQSIASFKKTGQAVNLLPMDDGNLLVALNPGGVALINQEGKLVSRQVDDYILRLARTSYGESWAGGVALGRIKTLRPLTVQFHLLETRPAGQVLDVQYEQKTGKLWSCYNGGLVARAGDEQWREITTRDGLLVNPCWSLAALPNGDVWYGYYNTPAFALVRPKPDGHFAVRDFRASEDILDDESITLDLDARGWLWRGGNRGISVATPASAEEGKWLFLNQNDGLPGTGVNSGSYFPDPDGSVWFGSDLSIVHYSPAHDLLSDSASPQVFVSGLSWDNQPAKPIDAVHSVPHRARLAAHIGSLQFYRRNGLHLRYRLLPEQTSWKETRNLDLPIGSLLAGTKTLEVQGRIFMGPWSGTVRRSFTVERLVWLTSPFLIAYLATAIASLVLGFFFYRRLKDDAAQVLPDLAPLRMEALLPDVHHEAGQLLNSRFTVGGLLACGGFANVMEGFDEKEKQRCAIKIFRTEVKDSAFIQRSFDQEVAALQKIRHPNVVSVYAHGRTPSGAPYLVMEYIDGLSLRQVLRNGALTPARCALILQQLSEALAAIHSAGICHRDVKPENIIVRNPGSSAEQAVLIDFSIAIIKDADETLHGLSRAAGTFHYMAPEQALGYAQSSSDIYSLARVTIEMLAGRSIRELLPGASMDLPQRVQELVSRLPVKLSSESAQGLAAALEFDPMRRPGDARKFVQPLLRDLC
jgi:ligand-binding sensor domain-containing protein/tRNA A-37 threonylcarbamoyl transferase component Bud32